MANNDESVANCKIVPSLLPCGTQLSPEWKAITTTDQRVYFVNRRTRSSHWFPPPEFWVSKLGLPYGWEAALDHQSKKYYINHLTRTTTREDPRSEADQAAHFHMTPPQARRIELVRDAKIGFGFVAGSEKPVVIRSVIPNGPSDEKLFANDQILKVNGQDVRDAAQADVISLIKNAVGRIELEVVASEDVQDSKNQHNRRSSLMSRTTRERRRSTPVSVRFADEPALVQVIGPMEPVRRSSVPLIPNVLKVFLENGQTRSFRYDSNTTAEEIFCSFSSKLDVKLMEHFSLVLTGPKKGQISYIQNNEKIAEIYTNRNCSSVNCLCKLNIAFVPKDHFELHSQDRNTFEYLYAQVTNRVVEGFYGMDLKYDLAIKLAALQIQQKAIEAAAGRPVKISVRQAEKEFGGLAKFVTSDLLHNMREKELRKILDQQIKQNENLASPGEKYMSSLQCKLHYLNLSAEMFSYGGRYFDAELVDNGNEGPSLKKGKLRENSGNFEKCMHVISGATMSFIPSSDKHGISPYDIDTLASRQTKKQHITVLVNLKYGVSQVVRGKVNVLCQLAEFHAITGFAIRVHEDNKRLLRIKLQEGKIQLICTTLDCLDMIALITGYYKVYVDNTSNTPLPVENEEKWPFAFRRDPLVNDALPDFYSRHRVVPDVWSYPSCFQTSNGKRKTQVENSMPAQGDVFLDLSRAPPRFNETAISEEPEEDNMVLETTDQIQKDETTLRLESLSNEDLSTRNLQYDFEAGVSQSQQDVTLEIFMSDKEQELLETASSFLKNTSEDNNSVNEEMQSDVSSGSGFDAENEDLVASRKRHHVFEKENVTMKSVKTAVPENTDDNQDDLISELIHAEEIWQEEEAAAVLVDERNEHVEDISNFSTCATQESDSSSAVGMMSEETSTHEDEIVDEQHFPELVMAEPVKLSMKIEHRSQSESTLVENNDVPATLPSGGHCLGTTDVNHNLVINNPITKTAPVTDESECTEPAAFDADENPQLGLFVQHGPLIDIDPLQDPSPSASPKDLEWDDSNFDSEGIELEDALGHGATPEGQIDAEKTPGLDGLRSDENRSESPVAICDFDGFELTSDSGSVTDGISDDGNPVGLENFADSVASHMVCLEFDANSDAETESTMSDEDESLWSTFPEYFHPSRRLRYSNNKQAELLLAEETQDADDLDSTNDVTLVGVKELSKADKSYSMDTVDASDEQDGVSFTDDSEELSTASSESFEYTYEVNAEFPSESDEVSEDSGYVNLIWKNERRIEKICDQRKDTNSFSRQNVLVERDTCINDKCDIPFNTLSDLNDRSSKDDGPLTCLAAEITSQTDQGDASEKNKCAEKTKEISKEQPPSTLLESRHVSGNSCFFFDYSLIEVLEKTEVLSEERESLNYSDKDKGRILDRNFFPADWIIPSPPSPTPELQKADICIVSPPPRSPTLIEDDLDAELKDLIIPPPPPSADTLPIVSGITIVSPPPLQVKDSESDHLLNDFSDIRFLSLTDDRKIARNNVLISARNFDWNVTEDREIQAQKVKADASFTSKGGVDVHKSIGISSTESNIFHSSGNSRNTNQAPVKQSSTTNVLTTRSPNAQSSLPNPSVTLDDSPTTWKRFHKEKRISDDHRNKDTVYSPSLDNIDNIRGKSKNPRKPAELNSLSNSRQRNVSVENRPRFPLKQKPPVPPKPRIFRAVTDDGMYDSIKSSSVKVQDSADSGLKSDSGSSKNTNFFKKKPSVKLESLHPTLLGADEQVKTRSSCGDTATLVSQTTTEDITSRKEVNLPGEKHDTKRSLSFTCGLPYVHAPYASSSFQSLNSAQSSVLRAHRFTAHTSSLLSEQDPTVNSSAYVASTLFAKNKPHLSGNEASLSRQRPPLMRHPASHPSLRDSDGDLGSNASGDGVSRVLPQPLIESSISQLSTVDHQEDNCNDSLTFPPLPDSPPPPLPESSPPKLIPEFDAEDFDFGELLTKTFHTQNNSLESSTFGLPSSAKELKFKRSLASLDYKHGDSSSNVSERREKTPYGGSTLSRSLTLTSFPPEINQRSSSVDWTSHRDAAFLDRRTKRSSFPFDDCCNLKDVTTTGYLSCLQEPQSLKAKCSNVCQEGLSKVIRLENRLEMCLNRDTSKPQFSNEVKNWPLIFQNNARFLACDIKVISSSVRRGNPQVVSAVETSLDSLEKLTESCEKTCSMLNEKSSQNGRSLVDMVRDVLKQYRDIISAVKIAFGQQPDQPDVEEFVKKTNAMATLIASLIRELRNY